MEKQITLSESNKKAELILTSIRLLNIFKTRIRLELLEFQSQGLRTKNHLASAECFLSETFRKIVDSVFAQIFHVISRDRSIIIALTIILVLAISLRNQQTIASLIESHIKAIKRTNIQISNENQFMLYSPEHLASREITGLSISQEEKTIKKVQMRATKAIGRTLYLFINIFI